jgi:hypothetical protein
MHYLQTGKSITYPSLQTRQDVDNIGLTSELGQHLKTILASPDAYFAVWSVKIDSESTKKAILGKINFGNVNKMLLPTAIHSNMDRPLFAVSV